MSADDIAQYLAAELTDRAGSAFSRASRIPSTAVAKLMHAWSELTADDQNSLAAAVALQAARRLVGNISPSSLNQTGQLVDMLRAKVTALSGDTHFCDARTLNRILRPGEALPDWLLPHTLYRHDPTFAVWTGIPTASQIRRVVKRTLMARFDATTSNDGGGDWCYNGVVNETPIVVFVDYGSTLAQLRYEVRFSIPQGGPADRATNYERLLGIGDGDWDLVTCANLESSVDVLCECVGETVRLVGRLESLCHDNAPN